MKKKSTIVVKTQFEGVHQYLDAPQQVDFLRSVNRHMFYVNIEIEVDHYERELEFIIVKGAIDRFIRCASAFSVLDSCETMASKICDYVTRIYGQRNMKCCVYEDNENGGCVYYEY